MLSISHSRYTLPVQFLFLALNAVGVFLATIYNASTPDLYPNNAHHKLGWSLTWIMVFQVLIGIISAYAGRKDSKGEEGASFMPVSASAMEQHQRMQSPRLFSYRFSNDSGQGTEPNTESLRSQSISSHGGDEFPEVRQDAQENDDDVEKQGLMHGSRMDKFLSKRIPRMLSSKMLRLMRLAYGVVDRLILILGFVALTTGLVAYGGLFVSADQIRSSRFCLLELLLT